MGLGDKILVVDETTSQYNFGNRFYGKDNRPSCALLFSIESVTKVVKRF